MTTEREAGELAPDIARRWDEMCAVESLFDAVDRGDPDTVAALSTPSPATAALDADLVGLKELLAHAANSGSAGLVGWAEERLRRQPELICVRGALGGTLLHDAARAWNARFAALLLDLGADVNACGQFGHTPLYHAANRYVEPRLRLPDDGIELVALLIRHGADLNAISGPKQTTPLHMA